MPQLVKGGKHAFAWTRVGEEGRIVVPPEAREEYGLREGERLLLMPGSRTSGGFVLASPEALRRSLLGAMPQALPGLDDRQTAEGAVVELRGKAFAWALLSDGVVTVPPLTLARYGVRPGDNLLVVRGSGLAPSFIVKGPIVEEARRHPELETFTERRADP
ncbi:MAG: AbrB/MazE/SpoVT family DNA-binding domain-containing protein [Candidatus Aminicenantes bacterium]|nr:AbrB/MazE/SpoVT family DNA-binding domain-containing protein [Candidatus Aminicenantes bacterium]